MFALRRALIGKKVKVLGELTRSFAQYSDSNNLIIENQITKRPFGAGLPIYSNLNDLQDEKRIYVDKSLTILELITERRFSLITRPRRFGKSLYLDTIRAIAEKDEVIKTLAAGKKYKDLIKYPVIKFDFSNVNRVTSLADYIGEIVEEHEKFLNIESTNESSIMRLANVLKAYGECYVLIDEYDYPI